MINTNDIDNKKLIHLIGVFKDIIPEFLKFSVFAYVLGFVIVNAAFMKYGFMIYDVVSVKYLIAGTLFLFICVLTFFTLFICKNSKFKAERFYVYYVGIYWLVLGINCILNLSYTRPQDQYVPRWTYIIPNLYIILGAIICPLFLNYRINKKWLRIVTKSAFIISALEFFILHAAEAFTYLVLVVLIIGFFSSVFFIEIKTIKKVVSLEDLQTPNNFAVFLLTMILVPYLFGAAIYPKIERMRFGGAPLRAQLIISDSQKSEVINSSPDCNINFNDTKLIYETPDSVFIALKRRNKKGKIALEIPKKNLIAIKYFKNK